MAQRSADATRSEAGGRDGTPLVFILVKSARSVTRRRHEKAWFHPSTHQRELISGQTASAEYRHRTERGMQTAQPVRSPIPPHQDSRGRQCSPAEKSLLRSQSNLHRGACGRSGACERQRLADLFLYELRSWPFWSLRGESLSGTVGDMNAPRATAEGSIQFHIGSPTVVPATEAARSHPHRPKAPGRTPCATCGPCSGANSANGTPTGPPTPPEIHRHK